MRYLLLLTMIAACADDVKIDPRADVDCDAAWVIPSSERASCDVGCQVPPTAADLTGAGCDTRIIFTPIGGTQGPYHCDATFEFDGNRGCCLDYGTSAMTTGDGGEPARTRRVFFLSCK